MTTRFTNSARNTLKDAAHIIETSSSGQGVFVTLTLPGGTQAAFDVMSAASGHVVNRLNTWLNRWIESGLYCYVWELQERGAPHLHYLMRLPESMKQARFLALIKAEWRKILCEISDSSGVDLFERANGGTWRHSLRYPKCQVKKVRYSYVHYLGKYLSKTKSKSGSKTTWHPGRWSGVSYPVRRKINELRFERIIPIKSVESCIEEIKALSLVLAGAALGTFLYAGIPHGEIDALSVSFKPGLTCGFAHALINLFEDGDLSPLMTMCDKALAEPSGKLAQLNPRPT